MSNEPNEPTIQVDSDWKAEAQREKQKLIEHEREGKATTGSAKADPVFADLLDMLGMQVAVSLGGYQTPGGETVPADLALARQQIAMLEALERKTKGNLSDEERRGFNDLLHQARMQYVKQTQGGDATGGGPPPGGPGPQPPAK